jgi:LPXTG-motif cell wall-anchored protein
MTVPDDFRFTIEGQQVSVHDLKPGMSGTATITTKTTLTPVTVTEVKNGEVLQAAGSSVLVKTEEGFRNFTQAQLDERGVRIFKDGKPVQVSELHSGDRLTATIVTTKPPHVLTEKQVQATLAGGGGAGATATSGTAAPTSGATAGEPSPAPRKLPKTASPQPMAGHVGLGALLTGIGLTLRRRRQAR